MATFNIDNYLYVKPEQIKTDVMKWLAERQAQKRYSKPIDIFFTGKSGSFIEKGTEMLSELIKDQNLMDMLYITETHLSYNEGNPEGANAAWLIDDNGEKPLITLTTQIVDQDKIGEKTYAIKHLLDVIETTEGKETLFYVEYRDADTIKRYFSTDREGQNEFNLKNDKVSKEMKKALEAYETFEEEWTGSFEPFVYLENAPKGRGDFAYVSHELDELVVIAQKKRDDLLYSSTKVVIDGKRTTRDKRKANDADDTVDKAQRKMAASAVLLSDSTNLEGRSNNTIATAIPNTDTYDRAWRSVLNSMLKKTGGATDVDAKGTVQQTKGELLLSQGDEFKVSEWKGNNRQAKIQELAEKIWKTFTQVLNNTISFAGCEYIFALLSQEEVLAEREQLENLKLASELKLINPIIAFARYNGCSILEAYRMKNITFGGENGD